MALGLANLIKKIDYKMSIEFTLSVTRCVQSWMSVTSSPPKSFTIWKIGRNQKYWRKSLSSVKTIISSYLIYIKKYKIELLSKRKVKKTMITIAMTK